MGIGLSRLYLVPELKDPECDISDSLKHFEKKKITFDKLGTYLQLHP